MSAMFPAPIDNQTPGIDELLALLPIVADREWRLLSDAGLGYPDAIRDRDGNCPLCALASELGEPNDQSKEYPWRRWENLLGAHEAGGGTYTRQYLDITDAAICALVGAADAAIGHDPDLRADIMVALGLLPDDEIVRINGLTPTV